MEIIPVEENSKLEMNPAGGNNPCGRKQQARDESDWGKVISVEQKSEIEMNLAGGNNPCGTKERARDASDRGKIIPVGQKSEIEMLINSNLWMNCSMGRKYRCTMSGKL